MAQTDGAAAGGQPAPRERYLYDVLRVAAAMCFIGHGAFGIITKASWLPYFAVAGIGPEGGYRLMPVIGTLDILLGVSMLRPTKAALAYMSAWALWTASLRPLAGQGVAELLERAGNYGVPLAFMIVGYSTIPRAGWFTRLAPQPLDEKLRARLSSTLRATTALLLAGHGLLAISGKALLLKHAAAIGLGDGGAATVALVHAQGWLELGLAALVLASPAWPVLVLALVWKVGTELLFPLTDDYVWEFIERGGSYGAPLEGALLAPTWRIAARVVPSNVSPAGS